MARLEDMRDEPLLAEIMFRIAGAEPKRPLLFHDAARTAYYLTVDALRNFEQEDAVGPGPFVVPGVVFWFMATESYVSTIYKTCAEIAKVMSPKQSPAGHRLKKTGKIVEKLAAVKEWVVGDCPPGPPQSRLQEFATFRNALFHDLTDTSPKTQYVHTQFAPRSEKCNQVDLFEALRVSLEIFAYFRFLFATADLMPSVLIGLAFEKIDVLAEEVLEPAFAEILAAKGFANLSPHQDRVICPAELRIPLQFLIRTEGPMAPKSASSDPPLVVDKRLEQAVSDRPVDDDKFQIPNYSR
jgi:hypothetical protein